MHIIYTYVWAGHFLVSHEPPVYAKLSTIKLVAAKWGLSCSSNELQVAIASVIVVAAAAAAA